MVIAGLLAPATLLAFVMLGDLVRRGQTAAFDSHVRLFVLAHRPALILWVFRWITTVGSVTPMVVYAIVGALLLILRGRRLAAATVLVAPAGAVIAYLGLKNVFARNRPSGIGNVIEGTYSFPSAHATTSAAVCCALAYICWREHVLRRPAAIALCIIAPALVGASRVVLDVHWATDVLGGWLAGLCIAALTILLYLLLRRAGVRRPLNELRT
ncbi:phosphatase PAP2 family protein [soil metagenome]